MGKLPLECCSVGLIHLSRLRSRWILRSFFVASSGGGGWNAGEDSSGKEGGAVHANACSAHFDSGVGMVHPLDFYAANVYGCVFFGGTR